ncbi:MAG: DNA-3-methyladenine glycosylase I [Anaerolineales bacterium]
MAAYHDDEWGQPEHDDRKLFEHLALDSFQAGLSWRTILHKRENFRKAFAGFDLKKVSAFNDADRERLLADAGIVRNRQKIDATINNAKRVLEIQQEMGSFDNYLWGFTGHKTIRSKPVSDWQQLRSTSPESDAMSADLKGRGFKFVGSTICYAFMQAVGMVDDHMVGCFRLHER